MILRPYQISAVQDICTVWQQYDRVLYQGATGSGKTAIAKQIIEFANVPTLFVVHRRELLEQNQIIFDGNDNVTIAMVQTLHRRSTDLRQYQCIVIDECHHATSKMYESLFNTKAKLLGLTATPRRLDGKPLGDKFQFLILGPTIQQLIADGYLAIPKLAVPPKTAQLVDKHRGEWKITAGDYNSGAINQFFADNQKVIYGDVIEHYRQLAQDKPTIVFCPNIKSVYETAQLFKDNGIAAAGIDGSMLPHERSEICNNFRTHDIQCLMSCDLVSEGFDMPDAYAAIMLRPTKSLTTYLQQSGRVLRMKEDKHECIIIDHVNNSGYFGPPWLPRHWSLDGYKQRTKVDSLTGLNLKLCLKCGNYVLQACIVCSICGNPFKQKIKAFKTIYEDLKIVTIESAQQLIEQTIQKILNKEKYKMLKTYDDFVSFAREKGWANPEGWATKKLAEKQEDDAIFFNGTRDQLVVLYAKRKHSNPGQRADEVLAERAKRAGERKSSKLVQVYESGTLDEIIDYVRREKPEINNPEAYARGVMKKRLAPVFESGTASQKQEAERLSTPARPLEDRYEKMLAFAKTGKLTPQGESSPRVYTDEEADKFAKAVVRKDNKSLIDSGTRADLLNVAAQMHIPAERREAWVNTVLATRS